MNPGREGFDTQYYWRSFAASHGIPISESVVLEDSFVRFFNKRGSWRPGDQEDFVKSYRQSTGTQTDYWRDFAKENRLPATMKRTIKNEAIRWMKSRGWTTESKNDFVRTFRESMGAPANATPGEIDFAARRGISAQDAKNFYAEYNRVSRGGMTPQKDAAFFVRPGYSDSCKQ